MVSAVGVAACGGGNTGDDREFGFPPSVGDFNPPDPSATPRGPIWLEEISSRDGTPVNTLGECVGFTIATDEYEFEPGTTATMGSLGGLPVTYLGPQRLRVGDPENDGLCFWTSIHGEPGHYDLEIISKDETWKIKDALRMDPIKFLDTGLVGETRRWTSDMSLDPSAMRFERPYDVDIYRVNFGDPFFKVYSHMEFFNTGSAYAIPDMEFWDANEKSDYLNHGGFGLIFPKRGIIYIVVKDVYGMGGAGATYDLSFVGKQLSSKNMADTCHSAPLLTEFGGFKADYNSLSNSFDPEGSAGCRDSTYNIPIEAPGKDGVWRVKVPPGKELRVSSYDDNINNTAYLLPVSEYDAASPTGCPKRPDNCTAAAGRYGFGNTDTLKYRNTTGSEQEFFLIHDAATVVSSSGIGQFLINVELFDPP